MEDRIIQWVEMDVLSRKTLSRETQQDPILNGILERKRKNIWCKCTIVERPFKKARDKLMVERGIISNTDAIMPFQILRRDIIKSVHDDSQRRLR